MYVGRPSSLRDCTPPCRIASSGISEKLLDGGDTVGYTGIMAKGGLRFWSQTEAARAYGTSGYDSKTVDDAVDKLCQQLNDLQAAQLCRIADSLEELIPCAREIERHLAFLDPEHAKSTCAMRAERNERHVRNNLVGEAIGMFLRGTTSLKIVSDPVRWALQHIAYRKLDTAATTTADELVGVFVLPPTTLFKEGSKRRTFYEGWLKENSDLLAGVA